MVQADVGREAKRPCKKKGEKKREETAEREDVPRAAEKSEARTNARASRPQFHAIESARTKLKTNRFPAPCWHALHLFAARATWASKCKKKKKTSHEPYIYVHKNTRGSNTKTYMVWSVYTNESIGIKRLSDDPKRVVYYHVVSKLFSLVPSFLLSHRVCVLIWSKSDKDGEMESQRRERCPIISKNSTPNYPRGN